MTRVIGLPEYLEHQAYFGKTFSAKYIKLYIRKTMLSAFHGFLFLQNILYILELIVYY